MRVVPHALRLDAGNAREVLGGYDVVVEGSDNLATKLVVNDACVALGRPLVVAGILRWDGQLLVVRPGESACYRCVYRREPPEGTVPTCEAAGIMGPVAGRRGESPGRRGPQALPGARHRHGGSAAPLRRRGRRASRDQGAAGPGVSGLRYPPPRSEQTDDLQARPGLHRVRHPGDDPGQRPVRRGQPRPGVPELPAAARAGRGGASGARRRLPPVRDHLGGAEPARGDRGEVRALLRAPRRSRAAGDGVLRLDRGHAGDPPGRARPWRRDRHLRAVLRELRPGLDHLGRQAGLRAARASRLLVRPRPPGPRASRPDSGDHLQHSEQSDRQGLHAPRARDHRRALPAPRRARDHRRDLRAHGLRRAPSTSRSRPYPGCGIAR